MEVGYLEVFNKIWHHCRIEWEDRGPTKTFLTDFVNEISSYGFISGEDILLCLFLGVAFTILRYLLSTLIFEVLIVTFENIGFFLPLSLVHFPVIYSIIL